VATVLEPVTAAVAEMARVAGPLTLVLAKAPALTPRAGEGATAGGATGQGAGGGEVGPSDVERIREANRVPPGQHDAARTEDRGQLGEPPLKGSKLGYHADQD
jgi:hypothetical protein